MANLCNVITKVKTTLEQWKGRTLTLMGRVLVINTLVESQFVYRLSVIPLISMTIISEVQSTLIDFLWKGKKPKISLDTLTAPKEHGGLRVFYLQYKHMALLCQWIFVSVEDTLLQRAMHQALNPVLKNQIWRCNLATKDVMSVFPFSFWSCVLKAWSQYNYMVPSTHEEILHQVIWYNSHIRCDGLPFLLPKLYNKEIATIKDIVSEAGVVLTLQELEAKFGDGISWLEYQGICQAIPVNWKKIILSVNNQPKGYDYSYDILLKKNQWFIRN